MARGIPFTDPKNLALTQAWLKASIDLTTGTNQKSADLWKKIYAYFPKFLEKEHEELATQGKPFQIPPPRTNASLQQRWKRQIVDKKCHLLKTTVLKTDTGRTKREVMD